MASKPVSGPQLASLMRYTSAILYHMTGNGTSAREVLDAKAAMEKAFGVKLPHPGATVDISPPAFPDLL